LDSGRSRGLSRFRFRGACSRSGSTGRKEEGQEARDSARGRRHLNPETDFHDFHGHSWCNLSSCKVASDLGRYV
jgi:hypothetical protein